MTWKLVTETKKRFDPETGEQLKDWVTHFIQDEDGRTLACLSDAAVEKAPVMVAAPEMYDFIANLTPDAFITKEALQRWRTLLAKARGLE